MKKYVSLTFDDGPCNKEPDTMNDMLNILEKHNVVASFFLIGNKITEQNKKVIKRAFDMGCDIENHSWTHPDMTQLTKEELIEEYEKTDNAIIEITGVRPQFFRPPFVLINDLMFKTIPTPFICGHGCEDWVDSVSVEERLERMLEKTQDGIMYLLHVMEGNTKTLEVVDKIIPMLKADDYEFVTVPKLFELKEQTECAKNGALWSFVKDKEDKFKFVEGGICAPQGFTANGMLCHIKESRTTNDTALIYSEKLCNAAGVFTKNKIKAESVKLSQKHLSSGTAQSVISISGNANACTGKQGAENAYKMAEYTAKSLGIKTEDVIVYSTGVIGKQFDVSKIEKNIEILKNGLSKKGNTEARTAIMTTDTQFKEIAVQFKIGNKICKMGSMCKGSGMIHINMGTMLSIITTDCAISSKMLEKALKTSVEQTYNCVSVDGDTSTNDSLTILANGLAQNPTITQENEDYQTFLDALNLINTIMAKKIASDGEGATRLIECNVKGAKTVENARILAKKIIQSNLVKAAMFGSDANFGRIICAMGYSGIDFNPEKTTIWFTSNKNSDRFFTSSKDYTVHGDNSIQVYKNGEPLEFDEIKAKSILNEQCVEILVQCGDGNANGTAWGCDLTYDYVKINGDYRT